MPIPGFDFDLAGKDSREIIKTGLYRDDIYCAALVDLIIGHVSSAPGYEVTLSDPEQARGFVKRDAAARMNSPCTVRTALVDGLALAPIVSAPIAIITCSARAMGFPPWLGSGPWDAATFHRPDFTQYIFMAKSFAATRKKRGRPATGQDPVTAVRLSPVFKSQIDDWAKQQPDKPSRSAASAPSHNGALGQSEIAVLI